MSISEFILQLQSLDIRLSIEEGRLRCNAPKGALTPELRETLTVRKEEILEFLKTADSNRSLHHPFDKEIQPAERSGSLPLSFTQMRLWFLDQLDPTNIAYAIPFGIKFEGKLDPAGLEKSINEIVRRQESLRTTFSSDSNGQPVQIIHPAAWIELPVFDLTHLPEGEREAASEEFIQTQARIPFELKNGPLFRANLIRLNDQYHWLFVNMHHIVSDGWSVGVFTSELSTLYINYTSGQTNPLKDLAVQYADYAIWQRQSLGTLALRPQLEYWKHKLSGKLPVIDLPADKPRPTFQSFRGASLYSSLSPELTASLKQQCSQHDVTLFMWLIAAFNVLLYRYTGLEDLIVGMPVANRTRPEIEGLIGFFVNTLALRNDLSGNPTFSELVNRVRAVSLEALANQNLPFENIVEALHPERDTSHSPIFQVMFILQNTPLRTSAFPGLKVGPLFLDNKSAKYDLTLSLWESPEEGLKCFFEYNTDLFEEATIQRMLGHFLALLEAVCADPACPISDLPLLTEADRRTLLFDWNQTTGDYPRTLTLTQLIEAQVDRSPEATAIQDESASISFAGLDRRANQLAHFLHSLGVGPESLVAVSLPRSIDLLVALLGIHKAGGAYLPLDPSFPPDRLAFMLSDSAAPILITDSSLASRFPNPSARVICIDDLAATLLSQPDTRPAPRSTPDTLAYVLYTSGSTGKPKGVQVLQRGLVNFLCSMQHQPGISPADVLLSVTTLSFDIAGLELYLPLISGARLVLVSSQTAADGERLKLALELSQATFMQATPATWRLLIAAGWSGSPTFKVLAGGEALPPDLAAALLQRCGSLWNMYGPTETTIWSTLSQIQAVDEPIAIGRPIANTQVYLLDAHLQPVPIGVPGELFIAGEGLARGYLNRPELTAEKFIPDPFSAVPGARMYRTGDLARFLPDGRIFFLGRIDHQVKIRGFRIELGEIEAALALHPAVRQAVVVARQDTPGDQRLVAYLTSRSTPTPSTSELRAFLLQSLPEYMLPALFVFLDVLPLTPNGKVDRKALPAPDSTRPDLNTHFVAPTNEVEQILARIWQQALNVETVGIHDNFFELGGHSLLVVQIHHQISQQFQSDLSIAQMFQYPTIQALAQYLSRSPSEQPGQTGQDARDRANRQKQALQDQKKYSKPEGNNP